MSSRAPLDAARLARLADFFRRCMKCGFCRAQCAVTRELLSETASARAKVRLARAIRDGEIAPDDPDLVRLYHRCLMCRGCQASCPSGVETEPLFEEVRALILDSGGRLPEGVAALLEALKEHGNPFGEPERERGAWLPKDKRKPQKSENLYFAGCATSYGQNRIGRALLRLLDRVGYEYSCLGNEEACCGDPALRLGDRALAAEFAKRNRETFRRLGAKTLFTSCAGCAKRLKKEFSDEFRVLHASELLNELSTAERLKFKKDFPKRAVYFDGCDLGRGAGVYEPPRELLRRVPGLGLVEFPNAREAQLCCGGPLQAAEPELAKRIARSRIAEARATGAEILVTPCPTCLVTLREAAEGELRVADLMEFLVEVG